MTVAPADNSGPAADRRHLPSRSPTTPPPSPATAPCRSLPALPVLLPTRADDGPTGSHARLTLDSSTAPLHTPPPLLQAFSLPALQTTHECSALHHTPAPSGSTAPAPAPAPPLSSIPTHLPSHLLLCGLSPPTPRPSAALIAPQPRSPAIHVDNSTAKACLRRARLSP